MGSEQSSQQQHQQHNVNSAADGISRQSANSGNASKLQRGYTIANPGSSSAMLYDSSPPFNSHSRPVSPPMSVCSDSDLPYISYTDRPIGDSPKLRNKGQTGSRNTRPNTSFPKKQQSLKGKLKTSAHTVVVVNPAAKDNSLELNADLMRLKNAKYHPLPNGFLSYPFDKSVPRYFEIASIDNWVLEQIDDDHILIDGYIEWIVSMNRDLRLRGFIHTQYLDRGTWIDGPLKLLVVDVCTELVNPVRFWYNITKLWTSDVCPPIKGSIPMFLPVMRGTLSLPANRDPEVLERLQPIHLKNVCATLQIHYNTNAKHMAADQSHVSAKIKEVDYEITRIINMITEKQKLYAQYAEHFTKVRYISQQLTRCNTLLNQNIESMEQLNSILGVDDRLEPFVWKTN